MEGFIKLNRSMLSWEWYKNLNTCRLFLHMLLRANWKDTKWEGKKIPRGSFISSIENLSEETGLTMREVRTAITHLESTGEITKKTTNKYTQFSLTNYCIYQDDEIEERQASDKQTTSKRQTNDKLTTTEEERKEREERKKEKKTYGVCFEDFWKNYPRRVEKAKAYKAYNTRLKDGYSDEEMLTACIAYAKECEKLRTEERFIKHPATFLGPSTPFTDYLKVDGGAKEQAEPMGVVIGLEGWK